jgi:glycosidase
MKPLLATLCLLAATTAAAQERLKLHVPSPDWRDQIIYFVMTDRFADGDARNNDQGHGEYDPTKPDRYHGGDLRGIVERLDYIRGLNATALWITPPVLNQWHDPLLGYWGYHGYWARDFKRMDPHVGTLADYQRLSHALHARGMYLVQDIVVNHVGNYFEYGAGWRADDPARDYIANPRSRPTSAPTQAPFHLNDPRRADHRRAGIYHWTPAMRDVTVREQELNFQTSSLDDLNTENPRVRRALRDSFGFWIRAVGVDAFRVDTAFHVPAEFFTDFVHSRDARAPGMAEVAQSTGRRDFLTFGEGFGIDKPGEDRAARKLEPYVRGEDGSPRMNGMLNFPLYAGLNEVFARGRPAAELAVRIERMNSAAARGISPHHWPSFVDNHDVDRWLAGSNVTSLKQALLAMMTLPGIPVLYYGTEQGFIEQRPAMFAAGWGSGGRDRYDTTAPLYRYTAQVAGLRRAHKALSRALPQVLHADGSGPGAIAWRMAHDGQTLVAALNSAEGERLLDNLELGVPGAALVPLFDIEGVLGEALHADAAGRLTMRLPARGGRVWVVRSDARPSATASAAATESAPIALNALPAAPAQGDFEVSGRALPGTVVQVVVDGDVARAASVRADAQGRFAARVDTRRMSDALRAHRVVALDAATGQASPAQAFRVELPWRLLADIEDPPGDDRGPDGRYRPPTHESYVPGVMDLRRVRAWAAGGSLLVELEMGHLSTVWAPANGFDHVAFTVFVELPGRDGGASVMPGQNAQLPEGMRWHRRLRAHGWSNALFAPAGATEEAEGTPVTPVASIATDASRRVVTFTIPSAALGDPTSWSGARLLVTTWDYDAGYRELAREAGTFTFGGAADPAPAVKVMDASVPIRLP